MVPSVGVGASLTGLLSYREEVLFEIGGSFWAPSEVFVEGRGGSFLLVQGDIGVCPWSPQWGRWHFRACAGLQAGDIHATGLGWDTVHQQDQPVANVAAGARLRCGLVGPLGLSAGATVALPLVHGRFYGKGADGGLVQIFETSPIVGFADLSLSLAL